MAVITKLQVDASNEQLIVSATSNGITQDGETSLHHKFTKIYVDTCCTFNCKNEPSSKALIKTLTADDFNSNWIDGDLTDYTIPFSDIIVEDVLNEVLFVWIEEITCDEKGNQLGKYDITYLFGVTLHVQSLYNILLNHININECKCKPDCSDVNFMLAWDGFNLAKTLQDYRQMCYYWQILHKNKTTISSTGCGCNS